MKVGQRVYYIRNNEVCLGTMVYNNKGIITIRTQANRNIRIRYSQVADTLADEVRRTK